MNYWYIKIPNEIFNLKHASKYVATYLVIFSFTNKKGFASPSLSILSKYLKCSSFKTKEIICKLQSFGFLNFAINHNSTIYWTPVVNNNYTIISSYLVKHYMQCEGFDLHHVGLYCLFRKNELAGENSSYTFLWKNYCGFAESKLKQKVQKLITSNLLQKYKEGKKMTYSTNNEYLIQLSQIYKKNISEMRKDRSVTPVSSPVHHPHRSDEQAFLNPHRSDEHTLYFKPFNNIINNNNILRIAYNSQLREFLPQRIYDLIVNIGLYSTLIGRSISLSVDEQSSCENAISEIASWFKIHEYMLEVNELKEIHSSILGLQKIIQS